MIDHVTEVREETDRETDHANDLEDLTEEEADHDHEIDDGIDQILGTEVTLEDMIEGEVDHQGVEDDQDHHHHNTEVVVEEDAVDSDVAVADVVAGMVIEAEETKEGITGVVMIRMVSMANLNLVVVMTIYLLMDSLHLHHLPIVEAVMVTGVGGQTMTGAIQDVNQVGTTTTVESADRPTKVKNGQGSGDGFQTDLR